MKIPVVFFLMMLSSLVATATNLYWIGGSGQWSDINHWSLSSGHSNGLLSPSIPQAGDNVIFDSRSGFTTAQKTVSINQESFCHHITVTDALAAPIFSGASLHISGNAHYQNGTVLDHMIYFEGATANTIDFNGEVTGNAVIYFMGSGTYTLSGKLNNTGRLYFLSGTLNFGSSTVSTGSFDESGCCRSVPSAAIEPRVLNLGTSVITLTDRNSQSNTQSASWAYSGKTLIAGTSRINITKGADDGYGVFFYGKAGHSYHEVIFSNAANPLSNEPYKWAQVSANNCSFKKLTFASSGLISTNSSIDTLSLATSKSFYFAGTQEIGAIRNFTSLCEKPWTLSGYGNGTTTIKTSHSIALQNVKLGNITATGGGLFTVKNGTDMGNNPGWTFIYTPKNLYWIGGGGNWEDPMHWTTNADGSSSGGCIPTRNDHVFFTEKSGIISAISPVNITSNDAECYSIYWNGVKDIPLFQTSSPNNSLNIFGSSTWQKGMHYQVAKTNYLGTGMDNTLTSNGVEIKGNTYFLSSGKWMLKDEFNSAENDLIFSNGQLFTNDQTITVRHFASLDGILGARKLWLGNSTVNINGKWNYVNYTGQDIFLNAGTSQINLLDKNAYFYYHSGLTYHNVAFTHREGNARLSSTIMSTRTASQFNSLFFAGNALLNVGGNPTAISIDSLILSTGGKYLVGNNMEVITGNLKIEGRSCNSLLEIGSYVRGTRAKLHLLAPTTIANAVISDIEATGASLTVNAGMDGGNNINVLINPIKARDFYWVGGSGNWSDPGHWSIRAGLISVISDGCLPSAIDQVFFDQNSGRDYEVNLDVPAYCKAMNWKEVTGSTPILKGIKANPLNIYGSLTLQTGMIYDVERTNFVGDSTLIPITTHQVYLGYSSQNKADKGVYFNHPKGSWVLNDALKVKNFGVVNGTFITNDQNINAENYCSEYVPGEMNAALQLGSSVITISGYWDGSFIKKVDPGASIINMTGLMPLTNNSGGGLSTNQFRSASALTYHDLNFTNSLLQGKILGFEATKGITFNHVVFAGESFINGSNHFNLLTLGTGKSSHLMAGSTQTVNQLITNSSCGNWDLDNTGAALQATIKSLSNVNVSNVRLNGINVIGGARYQATGIDLGNNSGWLFSPPQPQDLYWIGGSGNWSDLSHWTTNNDGTPSGGCLPTRSDHVFFNAYSGESPSISTNGTAEFKDMTWNQVPGNPVIDGALYCFGSITLQPTLSHVGGIHFLSEQESTIRTNGAIVSNNFDVYFSGNGSYSLLDDFTTNSRVYFTAGTLNTNGKTLSALSFSGRETNVPKSQPLSLILGSSKIYLSDAEGWSYTGNYLNAGTSHIFLTGSANHFKANDGATYNAISFDGNESPNYLISGSITVDSLVFLSKNSTYSLEASKTLTVNSSLQISGNNCATVRIKSTVEGSVAAICLKTGNSTFNFVSFQDINASCLPFSVLPQSTNAGNNTNINFLSNPGAGIGALGSDITICASQLPFVLDGSAFMPNENTTIQWTNSTTGEIMGKEEKQNITKSGTYQIKVLYGKNCVVTDTITISVDPVVSIINQMKVTHPTCAIATGSIVIQPEDGISYSVDGGQYSDVTNHNLPSGKHSITARNKTGCISDTTWITIDAQPVTPTAKISYGDVEFTAKGSIDVIINGQTGGTFSSYPDGLLINNHTGTIDLENSLPDQSYAITYTFTNGLCSSTASTHIKISPTDATITYPLMDYCAVGKVKMILHGSKDGEFTVSPAGLKIDQVTGNVDLSESIPGIYTVFYTYKDGKYTKQASTTIKINPLPSPIITSDLGNDIIKGQLITLSATGGFTYAWIGPGIRSGQNTSSVKVNPDQTATYRVIVTNAEGCSSSAEVEIRVKSLQALIPNTVITPNGDHKNDTWIIANIDQYPNNKVRIFDRAGRLIYIKNGYSNEWDGTLNGKLLNEDAYIFVVDAGNGSSPLRGTVSVIRNQQ